MRSNERWFLWAMCSAAALASAAAVIVLDDAGVIQIASHDQEAALTAPAPVAARRARLVTAAQPVAETQPVEIRGDETALQRSANPDPSPNGAAELAALPAGQDASIEDAEPVEPVERETPQWWSAEIRRDTPAPKPASLSTSPEARLPWQMPALGPQSRDKRLVARLAEISPAATKRISEKFASAGANWPPDSIGLVAIKDEKVIELHARSAAGAWTFIHRYPVLAASGGAGPKLRQGDMQVPEGVYGISFLNPDSRFHVSLRVNYPNSFDRQMAAKDGRTNLGGDIMIHGKNVSKGCLAIGDEAAEEVFVLAARIGLPNVKLIIAPTDLRRDGAPAPAPDQPTWLPNLYTEVASSMADFKRPPSNSLLSFFGK